jgi:hypothetical protein
MSRFRFSNMDISKFHLLKKPFAKNLFCERINGASSSQRGTARAFHAGSDRRSTWGISSVGGAEFSCGALVWSLRGASGASSLVRNFTISRRALHEASHAGVQSAAQLSA